MKLTPNIVDLSHYDDVQNWDAVKAFGILGVVNKASEGPGMADKTFSIRRQPATSRGILYAAYHFLRPGNISGQVENFLGACGDIEGLGLALDHEDPRVPIEDAQAFCELIKQRVGRYPWLYSGFLIKQQIRQRDYSFWQNIRLWLSHYSSAPTWPACWDSPFMIQFTGDGDGPMPHRVPGIAPRHGIDINSYDGTAEQLAIDWTSDVAVMAQQTSQPVIMAALATFSEHDLAPRQTKIFTTCFGGDGDPNASAYGGQVDGDSPGVALPARLPSPRSKVRVFSGDKSVVCSIVDIGPHHTHDQYWITGSRPRAEAETGNKAGLDMTPAGWAALGIGKHDQSYGGDLMDWQFET